MFVYMFWRPPLRRVPPLLWIRIRAEVSEYCVSVYKFWRPPLRRVPPLLWTRIRAEVKYKRHASAVNPQL